MKSGDSHCMYFVAILCPPGIDEKILVYKLWIKDHFGSVAALKSPSHITLVQPFWLAAEKENDLIQTLQSFANHTKYLEIQMRGFSHFGKRVLFVRVPDDPILENLRNQVSYHFFTGYGKVTKKNDRPFRPHITIATRDLKPSDFENAWTHFEGKEFNHQFRAESISLLKLQEGKWKVISEKILS